MMYHFHTVQHILLSVLFWYLYVLNESMRALIVIIAIFYIIAAISVHFHKKHHHIHRFFQKKHEEIRRIHIYSIIMPVVQWLVVAQLLTWFVGIYQLILYTIGVIALTIEFILCEPEHKKNSQNDHIHHALEHFSKFLVVFTVVLYLNGLYHGFGEYISLNGIQFVWQIFFFMLLIMLQAYHKYSAHSLRDESILILIAWVVSLFSMVVLYYSIPYISGSLAITVFYAIVWSLFSHYKNKTITKDIVLENIFMLILLFIILLTSNSEGLIL